VPPRFASIVFDCDSTLSAIEGIDELAAGRAAEVAALTDAAMRGEMPLEAVYARRLALIRPTRAQVQMLAQRYVDAMVPDARGVVTALREAGVAVRIMSGGLLPALLPLASALGLTAADVAAVAVRFDAVGAYAGFDESSPLARSGGKLEMLVRWRGELPHPIMLVGDGVTDLEAAPAADLFVAFAGVAMRPLVIASAAVVIRERSLSPVLALALDSPPASAEARRLYEQGAATLGDANLHHHSR
jgi:phosphoserine phosphatase